MAALAEGSGGHGQIVAGVCCGWFLQGAGGVQRIGSQRHGRGQGQRSSNLNPGVVLGLDPPGILHLKLCPETAVFRTAMTAMSCGEQG